MFYLSENSVSNSHRSKQNLNCISESVIIYVTSNWNCI